MGEFTLEDVGKDFVGGVGVFVETLIGIDVVLVYDPEGAVMAMGWVIVRGK